MTQLARLNRLRLRLGLFRWKTYASLVGNEDFFGNYWQVWWRRETLLNKHGSCRGPKLRGGWNDAVRHIRRCVRQGVRP